MIKGFLFDLNGLFYISNRILNGENNLGLFPSLLKQGNTKSIYSNKLIFKPYLIIKSIEQLPKSILTYI